MNREETEKYFIKDLIAKATRAVVEVTELRDFLINFEGWKYQSSDTSAKEET